MNIYLIGYMGSGKSSVGRRLAKALEYDFIDFDDYIEEKEQAAISEIFEKKGEIYFRKKETLYLKELTDSNLSNKVVATGGGTPCYGSNIDFILSDNIISIYLNTSVQELTKRLWNERSKRPLISNQESIEVLEDFVRKHLFERGFYYNQASKTFKTDGKSTDKIAKEIVATLF